MKAHPSPIDVMASYEEIVPGPVLDILGKIIDHDAELKEQILKSQADIAFQEVRMGQLLCQDGSYILTPFGRSSS